MTNSSLDVYWWNNKINFGDQLNKFIIEKLSGQKVNLINEYYNKLHYMCIGSILHFANKNTVVWGSGLISNDKKYLPKSVPKKIHSIRGPLTKQYLQKAKINSPSIFGDPGLLINKMYSPKVKKKYILGIVPHYTQTDDQIIRSYKDKDNIKIISLINGDCIEVINQINECENIISSSLHGLIIADAYQIPNIWFEIKRGIFRRNSVIGNGFKFHDYYESIKKKDIQCQHLKKNIPIKEIIKMCKINTLNIDLEILESSCPFLRNNG